MGKQISDKTLASHIGKLPKEMQPQRDLWSGIERAIQDKSQQSTLTDEKKNIIPMAWAASLIAAVLVAWVSFVPSPQTSMPMTASNDETLKSTSGQLVNSMQASFQQQKQAMLVSYGKPDMSNLPVTMKSQLEELAQARKTIEKALANDENNVDLLNLLRFTQQQELNLLQQLYPYMNNENIQWQTI
jgi:hypothetical protein